MLHKWSRYCRPNISLHLKKQTDCPVGIHLHNWDCQFSMSSPDKHIYSIWLQQSFPCEKYKSGHTEVLLQSWYINSVEVRHLREGLRKKFGKKYGLLPKRGGGGPRGFGNWPNFFPIYFRRHFLNESWGYWGGSKMYQIPAIDNGLQVGQEASVEPGHKKLRLIHWCISF